MEAEAEAGGAGGAAEDGAGQAGSGGDPGSREGAGGHENPGNHEGPGTGDSEEAGGTDSLATQIALALVTSELGAGAWPGSAECDESEGRRTPGRQFQFHLMVPFPSPFEADMGSRLLLPHVRAQDGPGLKEVTVTENRLNVRLIGEDPFEIRQYISFCLDQLSLMAFPPCFFIEPTLEKGS